MTTIYTKPLVMRQANLIERKKKHVPIRGGPVPENLWVLYET